MSISTTVPASITPEAADRIAELGVSAQVERMLEYVRYHIPELARIEVVLNERYDEDAPPGIAIDAYSQRPFDPADRTDSDLSRWMVTTFPPEVLEHIHVWHYREPAHAG
jgi:hypothetical protein